MLETIINHKKIELETFQMPDQVHRSAPVSLKTALTQSTNQVALIAEVKKASPSKGLLSKNFVPETIASGYEQGGADAVSVLTDRHFFQGKPSYLTQIKETIQLPVLRKDFIIDERQVTESYRIGADAILLIAAVLSSNQLKEYHHLANELGMSCLVEVHSLNELETVLKTITPDIVGINNRDLTTFETRLKTTGDLLSYIPEGVTVVSESGIANREDVDWLGERGVDAMLVGETLMKASSPIDGIRGLYGEQGTAL